jgi:hypothetical protein
MDNVHPLPTRIDRLVTLIRSDLARQAEGDRAWIDGSYSLCLHLVEMREQFPGDTEFGRACEAHGLGKDVLNHQTRAAAIAMGREPDALRACLDATKRHSLELIYREEFGRFTSVRKAERPRTKKPPPGPREVHAAEIYDRLTAEGRSFTRQDLMREAGVSYGTVQRVFFKRENQPTAVPPLDPATATAPVRQRMEAWTRAERKRLRLEIEAEMRVTYAHHEEDWFKHIWERVSWAEKILNRYDGLMPKEDYLIIVKCLHPDTTADDKLRATAFRLFTKHKDILIKPELKLSGPPLPSLGELLARRRTKS